MEFGDNKELKEKRKATVIVVVTFLPTLILCVLGGIFITVRSSGIEMNQPAPGYLIYLLTATAVISSIVSWFIWLLLGRLLAGGERFYSFIKQSTYPFFIPGSKLSKIAAPSAQFYDNLMRNVLGVRKGDQLK